MPYELLSRVDVELLHPDLVSRVVEMLSACRRAGVDYWAISGFRDAGEQQVLYDRGRTRPGVIATDAFPFQSAHNFGLAIDFARDRAAARTDRRGNRHADEYQELGKQARVHGLAWGGDFKLKEFHHVQLPGYATAAQLAPLRRAYLGARGRGADVRSRVLSRLQQVWLQLDMGAARASV